MRKVVFFMLTSLDGYFEGQDHDLNWHHVDDEFNEFAIEQLNSVDTLLFGRVTYEMMAGFWPSAFAIETDPIVAGLMNSKPKIVFSKTLPGTEWNNSRLVRADFAAEITRLKQLPGQDLIILGSSDLAVTFLKAGLLDEIRVLVNPIVIGNGKPLLAGIDRPIELKLFNTRIFRNGNVLLFYEPLQKETK
jgi:dihydrofolate reductase